MRPGPVLAALLRNGAGFVLLASQVALTLAIVANAAVIAENQLRLMLRPSGLDETHLLIVRSRPLAEGLIPDAAPAADLAALRAVPGVADATRINALPLADNGWRTAVDREPFAGPGPAREHSALFFTDERGLDTLGLQLSAGRGFTADDVGDMDAGLHGSIAVALISRRLADALFPGETAVGRRVYTRIMPPLTVIGVIERLESAWPEWEKHEYSLLLPARLHLPEAIYVVRTRPGQRARVRSAVAARLRQVDPARILGDATPFEFIRAAGYRRQHALIVMLSALTAGLLFVTGLGIGGTAGYWVVSRTRQIGTRRAIGARRADIVRHFMFENFLITTAGGLAGSGLAYALNRWLMAYYGAPALAWYDVPAGVALLYAIGQAAVLAPARRAADVAPAVATRGA